MQLAIDYLCNKSYIKENEKSFYLYGLKVLILNFTSTFISWIIAILFNNTYFGLLFLLFFTILRVNIGGYHCRTSSKCMLSFLIINIIVNFIYMHINEHIIVLIGIITSIVLWINTDPIKNNKRANESQLKKSKQIIKILIGIYIFIVSISFLFSINIDTVIVPMSLANTLNFMLHYFEKIRVYINEKNFSII